jgi:hypothetical protein
MNSKKEKIAAYVSMALVASLVLILIIQYLSN